MKFWPVVERELRVLSRTRRVYWGRSVAAQLVLALVAWIWFTFQGGSMAGAGRQIFAAVSILVFGYCLLIGIFLTADCVSEEKREGTLGLLFLTDLGGADVAFGKLAANSLESFYNLLAIFPVITIPVLLGGLTGDEIFRTSLVLVDTLLFSLTTGLLVSTWSQHDRKAQAGTLLILVLVSGGVPALVTFLKHQYHAGLPATLLSVSPGYTLALALDPVGTSPRSFWISLGTVHAFCWLGFGLAALIMRRVWQDQPESGVGRGWRAVWRRWQRGSHEVRARYREGLLNSNAYYWIAARDRLKPYYVLWFLCGCGAFWALLWYYNRRDMFDPGAFIAWGVILHTALKVWIASEAGRQFFDDRKNNALELTLSTPLPVREILEGQFLALFRQFGPAIGIVLLFDFVGMTLSARGGVGRDSETLLLWVAGIIVFLLDAATLAALGMWLSLTARRYSRAIARNLFFVLALPWIVFLLVITWMAFAHMTTVDSANSVIGMYFVISVITDAVLFLNASGNLTSRFRALATQRFDSGQSAR